MNSGKNETKISRTRVGLSVIAGSGNVFADLNLPRADEALAKAEIAHKICTLIQKEKLNQITAARRLGIDQPKISALMRGRLAGFSTDRLFRFLNLLGQDVQIVIRPAKHAGVHLAGSN
ncbi:MAG TPA: helix-turn-helix transcriptional regulator [Phycisphaerae bacterium]|nr:helix-turn-helix transcriptional regulator [Phycisphaerae bacterium]